MSTGPMSSGPTPGPGQAAEPSPADLSPDCQKPSPADLSPDLETRLQEFVGRSTSPNRGADPVNQPMIRHWVEAMGDSNPVYVDVTAAEAAGFPGVIAPPTMLQAWIMRGLRASDEVEAARSAGISQGDTPIDRLMATLDDAGFTSVVATNCGQHYVRPLVLGDHLSVTSVIESVSVEKSTALGAGHFITNRMDFIDQSGEAVATMRFRILKFRPRTPPTLTRTPTSTPPTLTRTPKRPRPSLTQDNRFFFEGTQQGKLLIQRCAQCHSLRHPPRPACPNCRSFEWDTVTSSGRGIIYSFVVNHYPKVPAFDYPLVVALVELEEGTRLVANVSGIDPGARMIGTPVQARFETFDDELTLPVFHPVADHPVADQADPTGDPAGIPVADQDGVPATGDGEADEVDMDRSQ